MKKHLMTLVMALCVAMVAEAQDVIAHKDGNVTMGKIVEISKEEVKYRRQDNPDGPLYVLKVADLLSIRYENGSQDVFSASAKEVVTNTDDDADDEEQDEKDLAYLENETAVFLFRPEIRGHFDAPLSDNVDGGTGVMFVAGVQVSPKFLFGPGVGLQTKTFNSPMVKNGGVHDEIYSVECPVFFQGRYLFSKQKLSPYIIGQVGYSFGRLHDHSQTLSESDSDRLGAFYSLGLGCKIKLRRGNIFFDLMALRQHLRNDVMDTPANFCFSAGYFFERRR